MLLYLAEYKVEFHDDQSEYTGAVKVTYRGTEGRICSDDWDNTDARVACRELGFQDGEAYTHAKAFGFYANHGPYWSSLFNCR